MDAESFGKNEYFLGISENLKDLPFFMGLF
jgi:hypothetical protein